MHFATQPPEVNSERMYSGPGSESMMSAATAWDGLAAQLYDMAAQYTSAISQLARRWRGQTATAVAQAATPHIAWLNAAAAHAELAATQAGAAARAYESALAAMVPPALIDANRAQRRSLVSTDRLGQTGPAIADAEAAYERMWAQDTEALYAYAGASAGAATVAPFTSPPTTGGAFSASGTWPLSAAPDVIAAGYQVMSAITEALEELALSPLATFDASLLPVTSSLSKLSSLSAPSGFAISRLNAMNKAAALRSLFPKPGGAGGATVTARFGRGASIGASSVPQAWAVGRNQRTATVALMQLASVTPE